MPIYNICLTAETEGVARIIPLQPRTWGVKICCDSCREDGPRYVFVDERENHEHVGGGTRNAVFKCASCKNVLTISIVPQSYAAYTSGEKEGKVVSIEVRGAEPIDLLLDEQWIVEAEGSGAQFVGVDLSGDWMEYEENTGSVVSVTDLSVTFKKGKKAK